MEVGAFSQLPDPCVVKAGGGPQLKEILSALHSSLLFQDLVTTATSCPSPMV